MDTYIPACARMRDVRQPELAMFCKDVFKGALSGLLTLAGATKIFLGDAWFANSNEGLAEFVLTGGADQKMIGGVEIIAALILFLSATRTAARTVGVAFAVGFLIVQFADPFERAASLSMSKVAGSFLDAFDLFSIGA